MKSATTRQPINSHALPLARTHLARRRVRHSALHASKTSPSQCRRVEQLSKRATLLGAMSVIFLARGVQAEESKQNLFSEMRQKARELSEKNDADFESSEFLKGLRDKSDANKAKYRKELQDRYCYRQAELGVGDCGGLQLIPGATKSGKQETPDWLKGVLRKLGQLPPEEAAAKPQT